jgi:hypothetical protein
MRRIAVWARSATFQKSDWALALVSSASSARRAGRSKKLLQLVQALGQKR